MFDINTILAQALADAVNARITEVLQQHANIVGALAERIAALETEVLALGNVEEIKYRIATLEDGKGMSEDRVEALIETAIEQHCAEYDHDSYDSVVSTVEDADLDEIVSKDTVEDMVRSAVNDAEITIRIR